MFLSSSLANFLLMLKWNITWYYAYTTPGVSRINLSHSGRFKAVLLVILSLSLFRRLPCYGHTFLYFLILLTLIVESTDGLA